MRKKSFAAMTVGVMAITVGSMFMSLPTANAGILDTIIGAVTNNPKSKSSSSSMTKNRLDENDLYVIHGKSEYKNGAHYEYFSIAGDEYTFISTNAGLVRVNKNGKNIFNEMIFENNKNVNLVIYGIVFRGKTYWCIKTHPISGNVRLFVENNDGKFIQCINSDDFYVPNGFSCMGVYSPKDTLDSKKFDLKCDMFMCLLYGSQWDEGAVPTTTYAYVLDYDKKNDKLVFVEAGENKDITSSIQQVNNITGNASSSLSKTSVIDKAIQGEHYDIKYPNVSTGVAEIDNVINSDINSFVNTAISEANKIGDVKISSSTVTKCNTKITYTVASEKSQYISLIFTLSKYTGGNHPQMKKYGVVYSKINGQRIPLKNVAIPDINYLKSTLRYNLYHTNGTKISPEMFIGEVNRIPNDYYISSLGEVYVIFKPYELLPFIYGSPSMRMMPKNEPDFLGNTAQSRPYAEPNGADIYWDALNRVK